MNASAAIYALRWLIRDTFQQALASKVMWIMLLVTGMCTVFCLGVSFEGGIFERDYDFKFEPGAKEPISGPLENPGKMHLFFGSFSANLFRDREAGVHFLQVIFGSWVAGAAGILFALVWSAGFIPEFLHPSTASVLLAKPIPRWLFLLGKYLGVVLFVAGQAALFFLLTWAGLGIATGIWLNGYLAGIPLLVLHFAMLYAVSVLLGVVTRSTLACVLGTVLFWVVCFAVNYGRHVVLSLPELAREVPPISGLTRFFIQAGYWILPKPLDLTVLLEHAIGASQQKATLAGIPELEFAWTHGLIDPILGLLSGLAFCGVVLFLAGKQLEGADY